MSLFISKEVGKYKAQYVLFGTCAEDSYIRALADYHRCLSTIQRSCIFNTVYDTAGNVVAYYDYETREVRICK